MTRGMRRGRRIPGTLDYAWSLLIRRQSEDVRPPERARTVWRATVVPMELRRCPKCLEREVRMLDVPSQHASVSVFPVQQLPAQVERSKGRRQRSAAGRDGHPTKVVGLVGGAFRPHVRGQDLLRSRMDFGVTSTSSSSLMNSMACSRLSWRGGISRMRLVGRRRAHVGQLLLAA